MKSGYLRAGLAAAGMMLAASLPAMGQAAAPAKAPAYDVATIKPTPDGVVGNRVWIEGGTFSATNLPLIRLLTFAYGVKPEQIVGVPNALASARVDVEAKMLDPDPAALKKLRDEDKMRLLRPLLEQRLHLKTHMETRQEQVYELTVLPGGAKMKHVEGDGDGTIHRSGREMQLENMDAGRLAGFLGDIVQHPVIDKTGLKGAFDVDLKWTPEGAQQVNADDPPDIFTAVQEQLGLKLRAAKGPVQVLVVDHIEMPSEN